MREDRVTVNGVGLWTAVQGAGRPVVLCPGGPGCCDYLEPVAGMIEDEAQVVRWEPRGCGRSDSPPPYDLSTTLADLEAIRTHFGYERWGVGGHSAGAGLALAYALAHPERTLGVLYLSGTGVQNDRDWSEAYHRGKGTEAMPEFAYPPNEAVNREGNASWRAYIKRPTLLKEIAALPTPVLLVHGQRDIRPGWPVEQLAHLLPNGRYVELAGAEHFLWLTRPDPLGRCLREFLRSLPG